MCVLDLTVRRFLSLTMTQIILAISLTNIGNCLCSSFIRYTGGIRTQIRDHTNRSLSLNINSFVKLLSQPHGL